MLVVVWYDVVRDKSKCGIVYDVRVDEGMAIVVIDRSEISCMHACNVLNPQFELLLLLLL